MFGGAREDGGLGPKDRVSVATHSLWPLPDLTASMAGALPPAGSDRAAIAGALKALAFQLMADHPQGTQGRSGPMGLPDNGIDDDATACLGPGFYRGKGKDMPRYFGPYAHHGSWRIMVRSEGTQRVQCTYATEEEGKRALRRLRTEAAKQGGPTTEKAIEEHLARMRKNGVKERSIETTRYRLRKLLGPVLTVPLGTVTPARARELFTDLEGSIDTRRNILGQARTFFRAAHQAGYTTETLLSDVKGEGRRHTGKQKLTVDESRKFLAACLDLANGDNPRKRTEGVASAMALVFGMRASEITGLQVRDLDAGGTIIRITHAKSQAGIRSLQVPEWFRPHLQRLAEGKEPTERLVGHDRTWLHRNVRAICREAGITEAPPHGLRGTHADLALMAAATPLSVSQALGHSSTAVTFRHYANPGIAQGREHEKALESLAPALPN